MRESNLLCTYLGLYLAQNCTASTVDWEQLCIGFRSERARPYLLEYRTLYVIVERRIEYN